MKGKKKLRDLVEIADVHFLAANFVIKIEEVDGATHPVLPILVSYDRAILEEVFHQARNCLNELEALLPHR